MKLRYWYGVFRTKLEKTFVYRYTYCIFRIFMFQSHLNRKHKNQDFRTVKGKLLKTTSVSTMNQIAPDNKEKKVIGGEDQAGQDLATDDYSSDEDLSRDDSSSCQDSNRDDSSSGQDDNEDHDMLEVEDEGDMSPETYSQLR